MGEETLHTQVAVIGGGPGGYSAAFRAADLGLDVALINAEKRLGGVCLLRGCIPSKVYLEITELINQARQAADWGIDFGEPEIDLNAFRKHKEEVVGRLVKGLEHLCEQRNIELIHGRAIFEESQRVHLEGADLDAVEFEHAILATGSRPVALKGVEFKQNGRIMDSESALDLPEVPERLLVVGGGYIGLEMASVYASLGSRVTIVELTEGLLPGMDRELVKPLQRKGEQYFEAMYFNTSVEEFEESENEVRVQLDGEVDQPEQNFDRVLIAVGRQPNTDGIGLENTSVELDEHGFVRVDEQRRTGDEHIYAVGDITGEPMLAHKAMHEGKVAAEAIAGQPSAYDVRAVPAVVYTDPQLAWAGLSEEQAEEQGRPVEIGRFPWRASGRALAKGSPEGLTKLIFDSETNRLLGMGIVGRGAETMISEGALAIELGAVAEDLALTIHPHPTLSETESEAAEAFLGSATHILQRKKGSTVSDGKTTET